MLENSLNLSTNHPSKSLDECPISNNLKLVIISIRTKSNQQETKEICRVGSSETIREILFFFGLLKEKRDSPSRYFRSDIN